MIYFTCPLPSVDRVAISADGHFLAAAGGSNRNLFVWDTRHPDTLLHRFHADFDKRFWHFQFEPTGNTLVVGNRFGVTGFDPQTMAEVWEIPTKNEYSHMIEGFDIDPITGELIFAVHNLHTHYSSYEIWEWDKAGVAAKRFGVRGPDNDLCSAVAWVPDSSYYVTAEDQHTETVQTGIRFTPHYHVVLRVVNKRKTKFTLTTQQPKIGQLKASRNGRFVCAQFPKLLLLAEIEKLTLAGKNPLLEIKAPKKGTFTGIAFHPNGKYLAASQTSGTIIFYETESWVPVKGYDWEIGPLRSVAFNQSGELAVAGGTEGRIVLWDVDD